MANLIIENAASKVTADAHYANTSNPHSVTKSQVGLSNVPNVDTTNPANITQDVTHRFITDAEKATWNALIGGSIFQTTWNATTNSPSLASGAGTKGFYYIVVTAGSTNLDGITSWVIGDWAIFDGTVWRKVDNTDAVSSVNGLTGAVTLDTSNVADTSNKRYVTDAQSTVIGNTSGANTGDNATNTQYSGLAADVALKTNKLLTINTQSDSYTLVIGDADKQIEMTKATANNLTIPANASVAFSIGTQILIHQKGAGQVTVLITTDTLRSTGGKTKLTGQYSAASLIKIASTEWLLAGDITT